MASIRYKKSYPSIIITNYSLLAGAQPTLLFHRNFVCGERSFKPCKYQKDLKRYCISYKTIFSIENNPKNLDLSYKTDLDLWNSLERVKLVIIAKSNKTDLVICGHSREGKNPVL